LARDCKAWLDVLGLSSKVHFLGLVKDPEVYASHVAAADIFLMTSREDPFPSVVLDAMAVGIPVVGFQDAGGFADLLAQGAGLLAPYEDRAAMADAVMSLIRQPAQARVMGETGQRIIYDQFQFRDYVYDLLRLAGIFRPKVSVVIPNYNYARYLPARIESVLKQTYRPYEIIFLDDRSTDDSVKVARELLSKSDIPYRIVENEVNRGCYAQWLAGIGLCKGDIVWIAGAEDECEPRLLEKLVPGFRDQDVVLAYCQSRRIDGNGSVITPDYLDHTDSINRTKWHSSYVRKGEDEIRDTLAIKNTIPNASGVLMRRPNLEAVKGRLTQHKNAGDWLTYVHLLEGGSIYFCPEVLNSHRVHGHGLTQGGNTARHFAEILMVQEYIRQRHPLSDETLRKVEDMRQRTFEYLGLKSETAPEYWQHPAAAEILRQAGSAADEPATSLGLRGRTT
jgi:O-antigen biosynthesis protein